MSVFFCDKIVISCHVKCDEVLKRSPIKFHHSVEIMVSVVIISMKIYFMIKYLKMLQILWIGLLKCIYDLNKASIYNAICYLMSAIFHSVDVNWWEIIHCLDWNMWSVLSKIVICILIIIIQCNSEGYYGSLGYIIYFST